MQIIDLGFVQITILDLIDISLVAFLFYYLYKLVRGTLAFNITIGLILIYGIWLLVEALSLHLLSAIFSRFVQVGVIALLIIFQPELRKFLLVLGRSSGINQNKFINSILKLGFSNKPSQKVEQKQIIDACQFFSKHKIGALICISNTAELAMFAQTGTAIGATITAKLLISIFSKDSPLHDGAVIIEDGMLKAANCILPISENTQQLQNLGLRHRSALGLSEISQAMIIVVSEETGGISIAQNGHIKSNLTVVEFAQKIEQSA